MTFENNDWKAISSTPLTFIDREIGVRVFSWPQGPVPGSLSLTPCFIPLHAADPLLSWLKMYLLSYFCSIWEYMFSRFDSCILPFSVNLGKCKCFVFGTIGYLITRNCGDVLRWQQKEAHKVFARNLDGCPLKNHHQGFVWIPWCACCHLTFSKSLSSSCCYGSLWSPLLSSETTESICWDISLGRTATKTLLNILFTSIFSKVMKENIMLLKGNKLLLFESKEKAQPACTSRRQIAGKWLLILDNGMPWTCCGVWRERTTRVKYWPFGQWSGKCEES